MPHPEVAGGVCDLIIQQLLSWYMYVFQDGARGHAGVDIMNATTTTKPSIHPSLHPHLALTRIPKILVFVHIKSKTSLQKMLNYHILNLQSAICKVRIPSHSLLITHNKMYSVYALLVHCQKLLLFSQSKLRLNNSYFII